MKNSFKGKIATGIIILATFVLAGVAIYTAIRLYQLRQQPVAPNVPSSIPQAAAGVGSCSALAFTITSGSPTPTGTPTPTPPPGTSSPTPTPPPGSSTPTPTPTPGAPNSCNGTCGSNLNCASNLICFQGFCRNPSCTSESSCNCPGTPGPTAPPPSLPQSGTDWPTIVGAGVGIITILGSLLLAL